MPDDSKPAPLATRPAAFSLAPTNFEEAMRFAELIAKSDLAPRDYKGKPGNAMIAMQMGAEVGLAPMQAIQNIAVINGRPSVWGDAMLALCQAHPDFVDCVETDDGETATCIASRRGRAPKTATFSMAEAKQAGLTSKDSPWKTYPKRMRQMRARGFALRDQWADVLRGLQSAEESSDIPIDATPQPRHEARPQEQRRNDAKPVDQSKVVDEPRSAAADPEDYAITTSDSRKRAGKRLRDLETREVHWFAEHARAEALRNAAKAVVAARTKAVADKVKAEAGTNPEWGLDDAPPPAVFASGLKWEGADDWTGKTLHSADLETLLRYAQAVRDAIEVDESGDITDLRRFEGEADAAIGAKEPPATGAT